MSSTASGPAGDLEWVLSSSRLRSLAGRLAFERGEDYANDGRVTRLHVMPSAAEAVVQGSALYRVRLWTEDGEPRSACSCPVGTDGHFCKHAVALALVATESNGPAKETEPEVDVQGYLQGLSHSRLVALVIELAGADERTATRLRLAAAVSPVGHPSLRPFEDAIDDAFEVDDFVSFRESYSYAERISEVVELMRRLLADGHAEAVIILCERALEQAEGIVGTIDDSDGLLGGISAELQELHLAACKKVRPDPIALAERLFGRESRAGDLEVFFGASQTYASVLGEPGLAAYRRLAERDWERVPALAPGDVGSWQGNRFRITRIMEALAELSGDVDAVVAVLARDLSSPFCFVQIAQRLRDDGRFNDALSWALRGIEHFGPSADPRLLEVAADECHRAGRGEDAVALAWSAFEQHPDPPAYERLRKQAARDGAWDSCRPRALERLREAVKARNLEAAGAGRWGRAADASDLVTVYLSDGELEQAWAEAKSGGCSTALWLDLARCREKDHPLDAVTIFEQDVERLIAAKNNNAYRQAVDTMAHVAELMRAAAQPQAFEGYAAGVRARHKPKRNLMKLLDARGW